MAGRRFVANFRLSNSSGSELYLKNAQVPLKVKQMRPVGLGGPGDRRSSQALRRPDIWAPEWHSDPQSWFAWSRASMMNTQARGA